MKFYFVIGDLRRHNLDRVFINHFSESFDYTIDAATGDYNMAAFNAIPDNTRSDEFYAIDIVATAETIADTMRHNCKQRGAGIVAAMGELIDCIVRDDGSRATFSDFMPALKSWRPKYFNADRNK